MKTSLLVLSVLLALLSGCRRDDEYPVAWKPTPAPTVAFSLARYSYARQDPQERISGLVTNRADTTYTNVVLKVIRNGGETVIDLGTMGPNESRMFDSDWGLPIQSLHIYLGKEYFQALNWLH